MDAHFELLHDHIKLTPAQREDARRKYNGISRSLYEEFYGGDYNPKTRLVIGSHGKNTETRHPVGDVDLIFKISKEDLERYQAYRSNGPSALLERAKNKLAETYSTSEAPRSWGKVVLVKFGDGQHDVEVMPCYENDDKTFTIPNAENGGTWDAFDPRQEMQIIADSQSATGVTRKMIKMIKRWRRKSDVAIKSYQIEFFCVSFLDTEYSSEKSWSQLIEEFFIWLELQGDDYDDAALSKVVSAKRRAAKARDFELGEKYDDACLEWRKVFGRQFPLYDEDLATVQSLHRLYPVEGEEFIYDRFPVRIDESVHLKIIPFVKRHGFRDYHPFAEFFRSGYRLIPHQASLEFTIQSSLGRQANYYWKIRNFHDEALEKEDLRGEIINAKSNMRRLETSRYTGTHYIDCYAVVAGVAVATARRFVPIGDA